MQPSWSKRGKRRVIIAYSLGLSRNIQKRGKVLEEECAEQDERLGVGLKE